MPERPLLVLPIPTEAARRTQKPVPVSKPHLPARERQAERLEPRFSVLQQAFEAKRARLSTEAVGLIPEEVIVFETVGSVNDFINAVRKIDGLEWLGEIEEEDIPPDDDFFVPDRKGAAKADKTLPGRLFLILSNHQASVQLLSLWRSWLSAQALPYGLGRWGNLFSQLRDVRTWGVRERLHETGVLDDWQERVRHNEEVVPCEIELWFRNEPVRRQTVRDRVRAIIEALQGSVTSETLIEDIAYHALLAQLPIGCVATLIEGMGQDSLLVQCEAIQFFRAAGQMAGIISEDEKTTDAATLEGPPAGLGEPVVALLDGLPLQNHRRLAGRLIIDDPDNFEGDYPAAERRHGTAMASLILHGDLDASESPLTRTLYVRPIFRPGLKDWRQPRQETVPENMLVVDLIHRAVRRIFKGEGEEQAVAPQICVINLSIGIRDRLFDRTMSPLGRLLDWLAWKYQVLFIVSAGNHAHAIECPISHAEAAGVTARDLQPHIIRAVASDARHRRLLSPAEAVNVLTVGAVHDDASSGPSIPGTIQPYADDGLPSVINAQGMGYRRAIKPEILLPGGRVVLRGSLVPGTNAQFEVYTQTRKPGQCVAAPGPTSGDLSYAWHTRGTSNAAALASRAASGLYDVLKDLRDEPGGEMLDLVPNAIWLKTLLTHGASWGPAGDVLEQTLRTPENSRQFRECVTRLLGYGLSDPGRVSECTEHRVTALGGGLLGKDQAHIHRFPLPPSLSGKHCWRRLTITLAWLTPVNVWHQAWRRADLRFSPPTRALQVVRKEADMHAAQRGTVQHEILEGEKAAAYVEGANLEIEVSCRAKAGVLEQPVPYALATTVEVAEEVGVDIYDEVRVRVHAARVRVSSSA